MVVFHDQSRRVERTAGREKTWRMQTGSNINAVRVNPDHPAFTLPGSTVELPNQPTARLTFLLPRDTSRITLGKQGIEQARHGYLLARVDTPAQPDAMREGKRLHAGIDELTRESGHGGTARDDDTLDELENDLARDLATRQAADANASGDTSYIVAIMTISPDDRHVTPTLEPAGEDAWLIRVGKQSFRYADGTLSRVEP